MDEFNAGSNKNLNIPSFLFLSIGGSAVFYTMDGRIYISIYIYIRIQIHNYIRREFIWTLESIPTVHFHSGYISSQRSSCYTNTST
jgi:hypothetical protein